MKLYRVAGGIAKFGPGQLLQLDGAQTKRRLHNLEIVDAESGTVRALSSIEFKVGEVIGVPSLDKYLVEILVPLDEPVTDVDKAAVAKESARVAVSPTVAQAIAHKKSKK